MRQDPPTPCACQRGDCLSRQDPVCTPELYAGHETTGILFVRHHEDVECPHLRQYSYGDFCLSVERIEEYLRQGAKALRTNPGYAATAVGGLGSPRFAPVT